ncbi:hypothetical protein PF006_g310 [Phytophthora fragariae]|uniref:Uncharacterized protein n=1 Tax=Phytophthora fragariae TaxID=53985 RepID=A0A6A3UV19_9STRA|nr:hypothetical protein PF006_g310 [Phytophthora fragariae]
MYLWLTFSAPAKAPPPLIEEIDGAGRAVVPAASGWKERSGVGASPGGGAKRVIGGKRVICDLQRRRSVVRGLQLAASAKCDQEVERSASSGASSARSTQR